MEGKDASVPTAFPEVVDMLMAHLPWESCCMLSHVHPQCRGYTSVPLMVMSRILRSIHRDCWLISMLAP